MSLLRLSVHLPGARHCPWQWPCCSLLAHQQGPSCAVPHAGSSSHVLPCLEVQQGQQQRHDNGTCQPTTHQTTRHPSRAQDRGLFHLTHTGHRNLACAVSLPDDNQPRAVPVVLRPKVAVAQATGPVNRQHLSTANTCQPSPAVNQENTTTQRLRLPDLPTDYTPDHPAKTHTIRLRLAADANCCSSRPTSYGARHCPWQWPCCSLLAHQQGPSCAVPHAGLSSHVLSCLEVQQGQQLRQKLPITDNRQREHNTIWVAAVSDAITEAARKPDGARLQRRLQCLCPSSVLVDIIITT
jgi:hypothetical protein